MNASIPAGAQYKNMSLIPGGVFWMGSDDFYPEERPVHQVEVEPFWMDNHQVTIAQFRRFVKATGYVTTAEHAPDAEDYPGADPELLVPGSLVFTPPAHAIALDDYTQWWSWVPGADWRHPEGPDSNVGGRERHPVTHISHADARAYADSVGKVLPTEAEWGRAARGGLDRATYAWGAEFNPRGKHQANTWQGRFPAENRLEDGYAGTSPVGSFRPNGYGLLDTIGNVWEWTSDLHTADHSEAGRQVRPTSLCCIPRNPRADTAQNQNVETYRRRVIKGGSHLCAPNYCLRYRPAARQGETEETSTCHIGFRCIIRGT